MEANQDHWETIYQNKQPHEVSWTQDIPETSLAYIHAFNLPKNAAIIDVGGGDSKLVDFLLNEGFEDVSVLDISGKALERVAKRVGEKAGKVNWIVSDITEFQPNKSYDLWHDRAAFHFLISETAIEKYLMLAKNAIKPGGYLVIGTFSTEGPKKCSGLEIKQYNEESLATQFSGFFTKISCRTEDHLTPFNTVQNFQFCAFRRNS